jgi:putative ABC transport system permease protein
MFSVVEGVLLRPLPYARPGELVQVWETFPEWRANPQLASGWDQVYLAWPEYERWREGQTVFGDVAIFGSTAMTLTGQDTPERILVGRASASLLSVLGVGPILGRGFLPGEDGRNAERVAMLGHAAWRDRFGADPEVLGQAITLNDELFTVVGILPQGFRVRGFGPFGDPGDYLVWIPVGADNARLRAGSHSYEGVARLRPGITLAQVQVETETLLRGDQSPEKVGAGLELRDEAEDAGLRGPLLLLQAAALVLLLIACGNVAMLLGEFSGRRHEMATRMAVGAGGGRLIRQLLSESVLLGILGSGVGLALALIGTRTLVGLAPPIPRLDQVSVNGPVLAFAIGVGAASGLLFGMAPSWHFSSGKIYPSLQAGPRIVGHRRSLFPSSIISVETALTALLLVSGGLLIRSLTNLLAVDPGFQQESTAHVSLRLPRGRYAGPEQRLAAFNQMAAEISAVPGVNAVSGTSTLPFFGFPNLVSFGIERRADPEGGSRHTSSRSVLPGTSRRWESRSSRGVR